MCHWVAGALLPAAGIAGRQHPLCVAYHCKRRGYVWEASWGCVWVRILGQAHIYGASARLVKAPERHKSRNGETVNRACEDPVHPQSPKGRTDECHPT